MRNESTARQIVDRIQKNLGASWKESPMDGFCAGDPDARITGVATSFAPSMETLRRATESKLNLLIVREHPFFSHQEKGYYSAPQDLVARDPTCVAKREFIAKNNMVVWRFYDNWQARRVDGQLRGLAAALGWEKYHKPDGKAGEEPYHHGDAFFALPETTLKGAAVAIRDRLKIRGMRMIGDPQTRVRKAGLSHGLILVPELRRLLQYPQVDLVVIGEPVEWEASPYFQDVVASGQKKGMIIIGHEVSEDPGSGEVARWLKTFVPELPIQWIPAGEPFWTTK
ncbi:MAG TPA: Nif3-like dinuclear metal center hexameric protein [Blastocatellia bacterium]|nr:Nif3-like dinuclear metal center hexameric protein [Blastocatellia bacterium]